MRLGEVIAERFVLESVAGVGGMGTVFRAHDRHTEQTVAIKILHSLANDDRDRFLREAQVLAEVNNPGVVRHVAHGRTPEGELYLAMEWLEGESLADRIDRAPLLPEEALGVIERAALALGSVHQRGVVHRDIKPSNLFLPRDPPDAVKVLDFGIARYGQARRSMTGTGVLLGTPGYMAPEQARGARDVDARADIFALGCVLFEALTQRPAFVGAHPLALLAKILLEEVPRVSELVAGVPPAIDELLARMMCKEPEGRPRDGMALAAEISALSSEGAIRPSDRPVRPPSLTAHEQTLLSVVLAGASSTGDTLAGGQHTPALWIDHQIRTFGGHIEKLADGSLIVSLAGIGVATDQAVRAARCALAIRGALGDVPMALATGRGVVSGHWPLGEVVERAAQLLERDNLRRGNPNALRHVYIDEITAGLLGARFDIGGGPYGLELRGEREQGDPIRKLLGKPTPFVGRDHEIETLTSAFVDCAEEARPRAVLITAPSGYGKSRLRHEFLRRIEERHEPVEVWVAEGDSMGAGAPFGLLGQAIRRAANVLDGETTMVRQQKLRARLARHLSGADLERVTIFLGELVGVPFLDDDKAQLRAARRDAMLMAEQMRRAWIDWLTAETAAQPVLLILEDLQWGDLPTVKFVDAALDRLRERPFMVLALARPEIDALFPSLWAERDAQVIRLRELGKRAAETLVRAVLGDQLARDTLDRILQHAAGNCFYLEELMRAVAEGKGERLPGTVVAMLQARLESLDAPARRLLRAASIFGQSFWREGVEHLLGGAERAHTIEGWLADLVERELITPRSGGKFPGLQEYVFRHSLVREAAYAALTDSDRALGHRLAGAWLVERGDGEAQVLGEHFQRGGEPARAVAWYRQAAEQALEGADYTAAVQRAERGVDCGAEGEELGHLRLIQAQAHFWRGEYVETHSCSTDAMKYLPRGSTAWYQAAASTFVTDAYLGWIDPALVSDLREIEPSTEVAAAYVTALETVAITFYIVGMYDYADELHKRMERAAAAVMSREPAVRLRLVQSASVRADLKESDPWGVHAMSTAAEPLAEELGDARYRSQLRLASARALVALGVTEGIEETMLGVLAELEAVGMSSLIPYVQSEFGRMLATRGIVEEARAAIDHAIASAVSQGNRYYEGEARIASALVHNLVGNAAESERELSSAAEMLLVTPPYRSEALALLARVQLAAGRTDEAMASMQEAMGILRTHGGVGFFDALVRLVNVEVLLAVGATDEAHAALTQARDRLLERAERIPDLRMRASFLERVPENARTIELARQHLPSQSMAG